jgi:hypothetical protein
MHSTSHVPCTPRAFVTLFLCLPAGERRVPLALYGVQLALNLAWQPLFFIAKRPDIALADSAGVHMVWLHGLVIFRSPPIFACNKMSGTGSLSVSPCLYPDAFLQGTRQKGPPCLTHYC